MSAMSSLTKELILLVLQFLGDEKYSETVHRLEMESGLFFDIKHFEELVMRGEWDEMERYLSGFTKVEDNRYSMKIFFEIRKQKYLEALDRRDRGAAAEILMKDLKCFAKYNEELFKEIALLLTLENFRENKELRAYRDTNTSRTTMFIELKKLIEANPYFQDKLKFPEVQKQRLRTLVNQSLNWQHQLCKAPQTDPDIKTLFVDHACPLPQQNGPGPQVPPHVSPFMNSIPNARAFPQMAQGVQQYHHQQQQLSWITGAPPMPHAGIPMSHVPAVGPSNTIAHLNRPLSPTNGNATVDYHLPDNDPAPKRPRIGQSNQLSNAHYPVTHSDVAQIHDSTDELLPKTLVVTLGQGSTVTSMEFHPSRATLLLVGTNNGDIALWDIASQERLDYKNFEVWDLSSCSSLLQESLTKDPAILVKRVAWSHDGSQIGVAYSKHLVHLYTYNRREDLIQYLEIEAHVGGVNDLVFPEPNGLVVVITCGDDKLIKIWDTTSGSVLFTFEGHETPVYSICPQSRENTKFIFSTSFDGKIKAWLYDHSEPKVDFTAPGNSCTRLAYTDDGKRLFSCGTSKDGDTHIVEWNESEGTLKRRYKGLRKPSTGVVQFDMTKNRFLAAGDDFLIKFWDMDSAALLTTTDAEGGLLASPHVRFNKSGSLLAVSTKENSIKVLASVDGLKLLRSCENRSSDAVRLVPEAMTKVPTIRPSSSVSAMAATSAAMAKRDDLVPSVAELQNGDTPSMEDVKPRIINEPIEKSMPSKMPEINESSQCSSMMLPDDFSSAKNVDPPSMEDVKSGINDEPIEKYKLWKLPEIIEPSQCCTLRLPDNISSVKISRMLYTNSGTAIVALASNGVHKLWKWPKTERNASGKATVSLPPQLWQPPNGILMNNEMRGVNTEAVHHFALSKNDSYIMSTSGGKISLFNLMTFKTMTSFMQPPPAATCLAFHPRDNNIVAIGMDDSSIQIYNVRVDEVQSKLQGHQKRITGLAFSSVLSVLVSAGSDDQVCIWGADQWEKQRSTYIRRPSDRGPCPIAAETRVQFHNDLVRFLVVHESQLAIYEAENMKRLQQRLMPQDAVLTNATYSCDGHLIYATFVDGSVSVLTEALRPRCRINITAYLSVQPSLRVFPLVVAAHPSERNQFAVGLTNGSVHVLEPLESEGKWGIAPEGESDPETNASTSNFVGQKSDRLTH